MSWDATEGMCAFPDRSGRPTFFTAVFNTFTPAIKESWVHSLHMAKLALGKLCLMGRAEAHPREGCIPVRMRSGSGHRPGRK